MLIAFLSGSTLTSKISYWWWWWWWWWRRRRRRRQ